MDKDRVKGVGDQAKGAVKVGIGKVTGDEKLKNEGRADEIKGKIENAVGGAKDALRNLRDRSPRNRNKPKRRPRPWPPR